MIALYLLTGVVIAAVAGVAYTYMVTIGLPDETYQKLRREGRLYEYAERHMEDSMALSLPLVLFMIVTLWPIGVAVGVIGMMMWATGAVMKTVINRATDYTRRKLRRNP